MKFHVSLRSALLTGTALVGAASLVLLLPDQAAMATTCSNGAAATIDTTNCTVTSGNQPTTVTFATGPTGALVLQSGSPTGAINATTAHQGNINVTGTVVLNAGATIGATTAVGDITIRNSGNLDASAVSTIAANSIAVGTAGGSTLGTLTLGNTTVTTVNGLSSGTGGGLLNINGNATINGNLATGATILKVTVADNQSLTTNSSTVGNSSSGTTFTLGSGSTMTLNGATSLLNSVNGAAAGQGNVVINGNVTLATRSMGTVNSLDQVTINSGFTLDTKGAWINANNITVGAGGGNGILQLGDNRINAAVDGAGGAGNTIVVNGGTIITGNIGAGNGIDVRVNDGKSLSTNSSIYRATTVLGSAGGGGATLTLNGTTSLRGWINGDQAGRGNLVINGNVTLDSGINLGNTNSLARITVNAGKTLDASNAATVAATDIIVGSGGGNGILTLGNTTVTVTNRLDGAGGSGNTVVVDGTATINGSIGTNAGIDIKVNDGRSLTTNGNTVRSTVTLGSGSGANATMTMQGTSTLQGSVKGSAAGHGNLVIDGNVTSQANIGSGTSIGRVTINNSRSLTMNGGTSITAANGVTIGNAGTLTVGFGAVNATIDGAAAGQGNLVYTGTTATYGTIGGTQGLNAVSLNGGANLTLNNDVTATTLTMANASYLTLGSNATLTGNLVGNNSQLTLKSNVLTVSNGIDVTSGRGFTVFTTLGASAAGRVDITGGALTLGGSGSFMGIYPTMSGRVAQDGDRYVAVNGANAAVLNGGSITGPGSSGLVTWATRVATAGDTGTDVYGTPINAGQDVILVSSVRKATEVPGVDKETGGVIDTLPTSPTNPKGTDLVVALQNLGNAGALNDAGAQLKPETGRGSVEAAMGSTTQALAVVGNRAETIRTASSGKTGISTGEMLEGTGMWMEGFGHMGNQGHRGTSDGYKSSTAGFAAGIDTRVAEPMRVGLATSYSQTWMDEKGARSRNGNDIESYGLILYSSYVGEPWYFDTSLGLALHRYSSQRGIGFSGFDGIASNKHDGVQYTGKMEGGYPLQLGGNTTLTPLANVTWTRLVQESYDEYGPTAANLSIGRSTSDSLTSGLGGKLSREFASSIGTLVPELRLTWLHEFKGNAPATSAHFTSGGSAFTSEGNAPARNGALIGTGLTLLANDNYELSANLDIELREAYVGQSGRVRLRTNF